MRFINETKNSVNLPDLNRIIPYLGSKEQEIDSDSIKKSHSFQSLILSKQFVITDASQDRIEQNLLKFQTDTAPSSDIPEDEITKVIFKGHFAGNIGYAKANRNLLYSLARLGLQVTIDPFQPLDAVNGADRQKLSRFLNIPDPDSILIHSAIPTFAQPSDARYSILYTTIEAASIPSQFIESCGFYDEIWVTSDFCKEVLLKTGLTNRIEVIPNSVDSRLYNETAKPHLFKPQLKPFKFISVASWNYRKGWDVLIRSYLENFNGDDPTTLLIVSSYNRDANGSRRLKVESEIKDFIKRYGGENPAHIARCGFDIPEAEMPKVYRACDAFVLPSRGEGFGLPFMEASLCGLPVISTRHSGQTMFLNDDNSYLFDIDSLSVPGDGVTGVHYWDSELFPKLTDQSVINDLGRLMRYVFENNKVAKEKNCRLQEDIFSSYSCDIVAGMAKKRLDVIWKELNW